MRGTIDGLPSPHPLIGLLPRIYAEDDLACRLTAAFDDVLAPVFLTLDTFATYLDPALAPPDFLRWLGSCVAADDDGGELAQERRRELVARAVELHGRRGTARSLAELVEVVTGIAPEVEDSGGVAWSARPGTDPPGRTDAEVIVRLPATGPNRVDPRLVDAIVAAARPAHARYRVEVTGARPDPR